MSNFHPDTMGRGGILFRFACSVMLWGGRGTAEKYHWCVGEYLQCSGHIGFSPAHGCLCFPRLHCSGFSLLYRKWALSCMHFPGLRHSGSGSQVLHKGPESVGPAFCAFPIPAVQTTRSLMNTLCLGVVPYSLHGPSLTFRCASQVCLVSLLGS